MIKIIIVDDHILFSQALRGLVDDFKDLEVIGQFKNGKELQEYFVKGAIKPDIVLMDVQMPIVNGIEATNWLKKKHPKIKVLALTMNDDETTILKMLRAGAKGYLLKDIHPSVLHKAIKRTHKKGYYYTEQVSDTLLHADEIETKTFKSVELRPRELELLKYTTKEMTYREIAKKMCLSPKTVDGYREKLFSKLDVKSRIGLVLYAVKEGLVEEE